MIALRAILLLLLSASLGHAQFPTIESTALSIAVAEIGSHRQLRILGTHTDELQRLVFSDPNVTDRSKTANLPTAKKLVASEGLFEVHLAGTVTPGLYQVRALGRFGLSNPRAFLATKSSVIQPGSDHSDPALAVNTVPNTIYFDRLTPEQRHFYSLTLSVGDQLRSVAYARQLDARTIPTLVLHDSAGREIARSRSIGAWPAEIEYEVTESGDYLLTIHDFLYRGGDQYLYVLENAVTSKGDQLQLLELNQLLRPNISHPTSIARFSNPTRAAAIEKLTTTLLDASASDAKKTTIHAPFSMRGNLANGLSIHEFYASKDQPYWIDIQSAQLDQLTDPRVILYKPSVNSSGQERLAQLAEQDDGPSSGGPAMRLRHRDPRLAWTAAEDGKYRIVVRDNARGRRPPDSLDYLLHVRPPHPGFALIAYRPFPNNNAAGSRPIGSNLMRGGTEAIQIHAVRHDGFTGPIEVSIANLPKDVRCRSTIIPTGATDTTLVLQASEDAAEWSGSIRITGRAQIGDDSIESDASFSTIVRGSSPTLNAIQTRLSSDLWVCVNPNDVAPILVELGDGKTVEVKQGSKIKVPVTVTRRGNAKTVCLLRPQNLPPKTSLGDVSIAADKTDAIAELSIAAGAKPGEYCFWMQNETKVKWRSNPQALQRAEVHLADLSSSVEKLETDKDTSKLAAAVASQKTKVEKLKKQTAERDLTVWTPTTTLRFRILPADKTAEK